MGARSTDGLAGIAASLAGAEEAAPTPDKGDTAWMMISTLLVIMMAVPGLALFYGGMVRSKNMLSVLMQVFVTFSLLHRAVGHLRLQPRLQRPGCVVG